MASSCRTCLVFAGVAGLLALVHGQSKVRRDVLTELLNGVWSDLLGDVVETNGGINYTSIQREEVLGDLARTRIGTVERSDESGVVAGGVKLKVNAALGEHGALVGAQGGVDLRGEAAGEGQEAVLENEAGHDGAAGDGQELGGAWVDVRGVHAAGVEEGHGDRDALSGDDGELGLVGECNATTTGLDEFVGRLVEVEDEARPQRLIIEESGTVAVHSQQVVEALDLSWLVNELADKVRVDRSRRDWCARGRGRVGGAGASVASGGGGVG